MPSVENGVINQLSPSMINAFDSGTSFGCERRWWYKYVQGLSEPQKGNQELGERLHEIIEEYLKTKTEPSVEHEAVGLYLAGKHVVDDVASRKILGVEMPLAGFSIDGIRTVGFVDVVWDGGIIDWKTTSDIRRYGKTAEDLATDTQMLIYAKAMHADLPTVKLAHGQFQTRGAKRAEFVEVEVTQEHIDSHFEKVINPLVRRMKEAATVEDVSKLPRNDKACFSCAFASHCPSSEGNAVMSFFKKFQATPAPVPAPTPAAVLAPDAAKSDPEKAAEPVKGFEAVPPRRANFLDEPAATVPTKEHKVKIIDVPEVAVIVHETAPAQAEAPVEPVKRGRGRPPGSKNKPKLAEPVAVELKDAGVQAVEAPPRGNVALAEKAFEAIRTEQPNAGMVSIKSVTVSKGFTVNLGAFNSVRFEVAMTADVRGDVELGYSTLMGEIEERLAAEAAKYEAEVDQKNKTMKPAAEVVVK